MIRVFIVAPTPMMQAGLHTLLTSEDIYIAGASAVPDAFLENLPAIDVVVVADDLQLNAVTNALVNTPTAALVVLTNNPERIVPLLQSLKLPGWGIVPLDASASQLQVAAMAVAQGMVILPAVQSQWLYEISPANTAISLDTLESPSEALTPREREVLELISQGLSNKLIARALSISEHTVKFHISSISTKLGASSRTDAVRRGVRLGLITL
ncbi:MAG TPA: response regulator transcription factor [Ktedonobacteraceae bacterium]|nr:response regulator transcription factor [Ktedonobacteraceae bacterium]